MIAGQKPTCIAGGGTRLVVAAVALLVAVAAVDAVWKRGAPDPDDVAAELRAAGIRGTLVYTDAQCGLHAVSLPAFEAVEGPEGPSVGCSFELSPDGRRVAPGRAVWGTSAFYALCRGAVVDVYWPPSGRPQFQFDGCAPGFRPDTPPRLTLARTAELLEVEPTCAGQPPCEEVVLTESELLAVADEHPTVPDAPGWIARVEVLDHAWVLNSGVAAVLAVHLRGRLARLGPQRLLAVFDESHVPRVHVLYDERYARLARSPDGAYVALDPALLVRADGTGMTLPPVLENTHAPAFSPDGRWLALAARGAVFLVELDGLARYDAGGASPPLVKLPIDARDLGWSG